jgi:hypothetical protein
MKERLAVAGGRGGRGPVCGDKGKKEKRRKGELAGNAKRDGEQVLE